MRTNLPVFAIKEFTVRRRYSDFVWMRKEIQRTVQIYVPGNLISLIRLSSNLTINERPNMIISTIICFLFPQDLPGKAFGKQVPLLAKDDGIFEAEFIEDRRQGLEEFINSVAGHPLVQNEKCLHQFLQQKVLDKEGYVPGKINQ